MSSSRHPIALNLERRVGGRTRLLATVMLLPLVDGIFPALALSGALDTWVSILQVGLLVFGGSATVAVIVAEMDDDRAKQLRAVALVGVPLVAVAVVEAAMAPTIASMLTLATFERFAALVILAIAAKTGSATIGEYLPSPGVIVGLGLLASLTFADPRLVVRPDTTLLLHAGAAGLVGVAFATSVVLLQPYLRLALDIDRFRFGSAVALGTLALSIIAPDVVPQGVALPVFAVAGILAVEPGAADADDDESDAGESGDSRGVVAQVEDAVGSVAEDVASRAEGHAPGAAAADGGADDDERTYEPRDDYPGDTGGSERAPWL